MPHIFAVSRTSTIFLPNSRIPLTFNFTTLLAPPNPDESLSVFSTFLGQNINLTPLGSGFNAWFPLFILIPVLFTLSGLYDKIKGFIGLGDFGGWIIEDDDDEDRGEIASVVEGRAILKRELGLTGAPAPTRGENREGRVFGTGRPVRPTYSDDPDLDNDDEGSENFLVAAGHRLWNSISNRVDDLRTEGGEEGESGNEDAEGGLLGRIPRPKWLKRGGSGGNIWRLPRWGRGENDGRIVL
jgi:hypothetical protein